MGCITPQKLPTVPPQQRQKYSSIDIDTQCKALPYFSLKGKTLIYIGHFDEFTQKTQILWATAFGKRNSFKVKIIQSNLMKQQWWLGVIDRRERQKRWTNQFNADNKNWYGYCANSNIVGGGDRKIKKQGTGFRKGDQIEIKMDIQKGIVEWKVNGIVQARLTAKNLKDKTIQWVPYWMVVQQKYAIQYLG